MKAVRSYEGATEGADTRARVLCAAESLLIDYGYAGMSARAIAKAAKVNVAASSYHFGSKQGVLEAVVQRRLAPVNKKRLRLLASVKADPSASVEQVLHAFLWPVFETEPEDPVRLLMGRLMAEPTALVGSVIEETFHEVAEAFVSALKGCMVDPCRDSILRKLSFVLGATSCTLLNKDAVGLGPDAAQHQLFEQLLSFCVRGMSESNTVSN